MKVLLISAYPPSPHNIGFPSALPFYLAKNTPDFIKSIDLMYFEGHDDKRSYYEEPIKKVFSKIYFHKINRLKLIKYKLMDIFGLSHNFKGAAYRCLPSNNLFSELEEYDLFWIYPCVLFPWAERLKEKGKVLITTPDCSLLHYELAIKTFKKGSTVRKLCSNDKQVNNLDNLYSDSLFRENELVNSNHILHVVGKDDKKRYSALNPRKENVFFNIHPLYEFKKKVKLNEKKLSILISGNNNSIYIGDLADRILNLIIENNIFFMDKIKISILGKKFDTIISKLEKSNIEVNQIGWVDSYEDEIIKHDIHLFPIIIGTGTKGKVLCSLASGLICIGNKYAFENIYVGDNKLLHYKDEYEAIDLLKVVIKSKFKFFKDAMKISKEVIKNHGEKRVGKMFWNNVKNFLK